MDGRRSNEARHAGELFTFRLSLRSLRKTTAPSALKLCLSLLSFAAFLCVLRPPRFPLLLPLLLFYPHSSKPNLTVRKTRLSNRQMSIVEQEAIRRVIAGDQDAFRVLMDRHLPTILRLTMNITGNKVDAEEATQEAFLLAYNKLPSFREDSAFGTWVYRIAVNCSLNLVKRRERDLGWNAQPLELNSSGDEIVASTRLNPEAEFLQNESFKFRQQALLILTPMERTAFLLRHMEDESMDTIASALGVSINSAKQAVFRAVLKLRKQLIPSESKLPINVPRTHLSKEPQ